MTGTSATKRPDGTLDFENNDDGSCYIVGGGLGVNVAKLKEDLSGIDGPMWQVVAQGSE